MSSYLKSEEKSVFRNLLEKWKKYWKGLGILSARKSGKPVEIVNAVIIRINASIVGQNLTKHGKR